MSAATQWTAALQSWAIPPQILAAAPESPWGFPTAVFEQKADTFLTLETPSIRHARAAMPAGGSVADIGCGAGAGSLPLATTAGHLIGVDPLPAMLQAFRTRAKALGVAVTTIEGAWPDVADSTPLADVVVCHHVAYNVPDLAPFLLRLTDHARQRVVLELTARHPMAALNDLWLQFHGLARPTGPTADDVVAVLREIGLSPEREDWPAPNLLWRGPSARRDLVAWVRRRLCLTAAHDPALDAALTPRILEDQDTAGFPPRPVVTLWWRGTAS
jgi:SAM-dependent methyltransferase